MAREISRDYRGKNPLIIGVLTGSFIFVADLVRAMEVPVTVDFVDAASYRATASTGEVAVTRNPGLELRGRHIILAEDIVDTGRTATHIMESLRQSGPASLRLCTLLDKPSRRTTKVQIDYVGFQVPDEFIVGYGLDLDESYRGFPDIYTLNTPASNTPDSQIRQIQTRPNSPR